MVAVTADNETIKSVDDLIKDMKVAADWNGTTGANKSASETAQTGKIRKEAVILNGLNWLCCN